MMNQIFENFDDYVLFHENCKETTKRLSSNVVDLIYLDPPFCSGKSYSLKEHRFHDKYKDPEEYVQWLKPKLIEYQRILKLSGSIYIHCDWHISHYLKVLADKIFNKKNFLNEIVWQRQSSHNNVKQGSRHFGRIHDNLLIYTKSDNYVWNQQFLPYNEAYIKSTYRYIETRTERKYALGDLTGPGGEAKRNPKYKFLGIERYWRYNETKMQYLLDEGKIVHKPGRVPLLKRYLDEMMGKPVQDIWTDIKPDGNCGKMYPTQKPENLLERILRISSNPGQLIYDPFAGSSTSGVVSFRLSRRWIGSEILKKSCILSINRLRSVGCKAKIYSNSNSLESLNKIEIENQYCFHEVPRCQ